MPRLGVLQQYLEEGKGSVGTHLNVSHGRPHPRGYEGLGGG